MIRASLACITALATGLAFQASDESWPPLKRDVLASKLRNLELDDRQRTTFLQAAMAWQAITPAADDSSGLSPEQSLIANKLTDNLLSGDEQNDLEREVAKLLSDRIAKLQALEKNAGVATQTAAETLRFDQLIRALHLEAEWKLALEKAILLQAMPQARWEAAKNQMVSRILASRGVVLNFESAGGSVSIPILKDAVRWVDEEARSIDFLDRFRSDGTSVQLREVVAKGYFFANSDPRTIMRDLIEWVKKLVVDPNAKELLIRYKARI